MRKDAVRNRELLIAAGRAVFAKRGLSASLDDIARQAGVGVGTAYRHFTDKFDLAEAIMDKASREVLLAAQEAAQNEDPWAGLVAFLEFTLELHTKDRGLRELMMGVTSERYRQRARDLLVEPVSTLLRRAQDAGVVRADAVPSDLGCTLMMLYQIADLGGPAAPGLWRRYLPTLLSALRPTGPPFPGVPLTNEQFQAATRTLANCAPPPGSPD